MIKTRGYFGIGIFNPMNSVNIGTLWRSAFIFEADFIFTIGRRYSKQVSDTVAAYKHVPLYHYKNWVDFYSHLPKDARLVCVENGVHPRIRLHDFTHPERAVYVLGAEDDGIPERFMRNQLLVEVETTKSLCLNVATAGSIVMYDRYLKRQRLPSIYMEGFEHGEMELPD